MATGDLCDEPRSPGDFDIDCAVDVDDLNITLVIIVSGMDISILHNNSLMNASKNSIKLCWRISRGAMISVYCNV